MVGKRKPKPRDKDDEHLDRWLVSYADYMTLMFALFVVLYAMAIVKEENYRVLSETLGTLFQAKTEVGTGVKGEGMLHHNEQVDSDKDLYGTSLLPDKGPELVDGRNDVSNITNKKNGRPLEGLAKELDNALYDLEENGVAKVDVGEDWLTIELSSELMFVSGSATPTHSAELVLKTVSDIIRPIDNFVRVRGYTDDLPIHTELYASNWELSVARATAALKILVDNQIAPGRMAIEGYGQYSPFVLNDSESGRRENRKVVIAISKFAYVPNALPKAKKTLGKQPTIKQNEDYSEVQVIRLPNGGIRITTRRDNPDAVKPQDKEKNR